MTLWYLGTSGWCYSWNPQKSLSWFIDHTPCNSIELNMSYYRYPHPKMVARWAETGASLAWVIKVHRSITHYKKLNKDSYEQFTQFRALFEPLESSIHYYLLQLSPSFSDLPSVEHFIAACGTDKIAIEFRTPSMMNTRIQHWAEAHKVLLVSVDAPHLPSQLQSTHTLYLRIHGRTTWYDYTYNHEELTNLYRRITEQKPDTVFIYFNNYAMYPNMLSFHTILQQNNEELRKK
ncbi:MAG: DUF72 domain-containing protein [Candidatus Thermoplasmatota archaeon]|nr:DUF72 domain-containing protein [Candidatus Thermoplasmatota archaeon]MBU1941119.1 DUF72 domain-containing protein [Candidatus Thermoplasmatota archaeon]